MNVLFIAPVSKYEAKDSGYGNSAAGIAKALNKMQDRGKIKKLTVVNTLELEKSYAKMPDIEYDVSILVINPNVLSQPHITQLITRITKRVKRKYLNILWETLPLPRKWKSLWESSLFDGFVVSSYFVAYQVQQYVTNKRVFYYPLHIDVEDFKSIDISKKREEENFSVLYVGQNTERKGLKDTISVYSRAFDGIDDTQLVVKCYNLSDFEETAESLIARTAKTNMRCKESPIYLTEENFSQKQMLELYQSSSVLLFLSRGEGFGLPAVEAMSVGIPVIYTGWSALAEVADAPGNCPISYTLDEAVGMFHHGYEIGSVYAVPSISHSMVVLREYYNKWKKNKEEYYLGMKQHREIVKKRYGYDTVLDCLDHIINNKEGFAPEKYFNKALWDKQEEQWNKIVVRNTK